MLRAILFRCFSSRLSECNLLRLNPSLSISLFLYFSLSPPPSLYSLSLSLSFSLSLSLSIYIYICMYMGGVITSHMRAGMGYQNEFQTENYGPLTNEALFPYGCALSHMWNAWVCCNIVNIIWRPFQKTSVEKPSIHQDEKQWFDPWEKCLGESINPACCLAQI